MRVVSGPPLPVNSAEPPRSKVELKATVPLLLMAGNQMRSSGPLLSAMLTNS